MRSILIVTAGAALLASGAADAQRVVTRGPGAGYPVPGRTPVVQPYPGAGTPMVQPGGRWGSRVGGRWWGGANAPGGWNAYRRPARGTVLPSYWVAPRFTVDDWQAYGLRAPGTGYSWVRYYDDAVLIDARGSVYDQVSDVDWDRGTYGDGEYDGDVYQGDTVVYADQADRRYAYDGGREGPYRGGRRDDIRGSDGIGGAVVGGIAGGVAGNLIAGRGNRLGGSLIGAGVGALAGLAIDAAEDRRRRRERDRRVPIAPDYAPDYAPERSYAPPPPSYTMHGGAPGWTSPDGRTVVTTSSHGYGGSSTTVVVQSAPVITTITTEVIEDHVTYSRAPIRRKVVRRAWKPAPRCAC